MDSPYANGAYSPPYPPYASLPQARGYFCSGPPRSPYPTDPPGLYRPPSPAPAWSYGPSECPSEGSALRRQQVPGYSPPQVRDTVQPWVGVCGSWDGGFGALVELGVPVALEHFVLPGFTLNKDWWSPCALETLSFWAGKAGIGQAA